MRNQSRFVARKCVCAEPIKVSSDRTQLCDMREVAREPRGRGVKLRSSELESERSPQVLDEPSQIAMSHLPFVGFTTNLYQLVLQKKYLAQSCRTLNRARLV